MSSTVWPLIPSITAFGLAAVVVGVVGTRLTARAEQLASVTRLGQAIVGAVFLGAVTSLSGLITSLSAAYEGHAELSVSNAVGGIAVQTLFLALADLAHRKANLEHAAASEANLVQAALLVILLAIPLAIGYAGEVTMLGVHPGSLLLLGAYAFGLYLLRTSTRQPMWRPRLTRHTVEDSDEEYGPEDGSLRHLATQFVILAVIVSIAGWVLAQSGIAIAHHSGLSEGLIGTLLTATSTSLPEAVVAVSAVRRGAPTLAVGDIIGGNTFDVLFLSFSDMMYRPGSIYHSVTAVQSFWLALSLLMAALILLGLLRREQHGIANIGFEGIGIIALYLGGVALLLWSG